MDINYVDVDDTDDDAEIIEINAMNDEVDNDEVDNDEVDNEEEDTNTYTTRDSFKLLKQIKRNVQRLYDYNSIIYDANLIIEKNTITILNIMSWIFIMLIVIFFAICIIAIVKFNFIF
jgi:hypothetical protein